MIGARAVACLAWMVAPGAYGQPQAPSDPAADDPPAEKTERKADKEANIPMPGSYNPRTDARPDQEAARVDPPGLKKKKTARRPYPRRLFDDLSLPRTCDVRVTLDARGRPAAIAPDGCVDRDLFDYTARRVRKDRWHKPVPAGAVVRVAVTYEPPVDQVELPVATYWRRRAHTVCKVHLEISPEGVAETARQQGDCGLSATAVAPPPLDRLRGKGPSVCGVTFQAVEGEAVQVVRLRCPLHLWAPAREALASVRWPTAEGTPGPQPWSALLQFNHPGRE